MRYGHLLMSLFCAWVLWSTTSEMQSAVPIDGFETKEKCAKEISWLEIMQSGGQKLNPSSADKLMRWHCLPDTIDPRAPKAGR
jgi:hypothetical protein